jgi:hypothetical protein
MIDKAYYPIYADVLGGSLNVKFEYIHLMCAGG